MLTVFALASGRSGTHFLYELIRRNARGCVSRHEPYGFNPSMFGRPIYERAVGERSYTRKLLKRKQRVIERCGAGVYVETSHAFLKSWSDLAPEFFPNLKVVHLVREPLKVAKSEAYREELIRWLRVPLCHYRGDDGRRYFLWALTGREPIFQSFELEELTRLQWYLIQWIEIENRAMQFLDRFGKHAECFTLHSPHDLNDQGRVRELFDFLGVALRRSGLDMTGRRNKNWRPTIVTADDKKQLAEVVRLMPATYLDIFRREPYASFPWIESLTPK